MPRCRRRRDGWPAKIWSTRGAGSSLCSSSASRCAGGTTSGSAINTPDTRRDGAHWVKALGNLDYPAAEHFVLVMDRLNTHSPASLYAAFPPAEAKRLADKLDIHYSSKHGRWLNMAEIELSALQRPCLNRWLGDRATLEREVAVWTAARNATATTIDRHLTTADARIKLRHLYPVFHA